MKTNTTANTLPVTNEPIISSDFWSTESYLMHNILNAIEKRLPDFKSIVRDAKLDIIIDNEKESL